MRLQSAVFAAFSFALAFNVSANQRRPTASQVPPAVVKASNEFGLDLFQKVQQEHANISGQLNNDAVSPVSAFLALALAYNGAGPHMRDSMAKSLKIQNISIDTLNFGARQLNARLTDSESDFVLTIANSLWIKSGFAVRPSYTERMASDYGAQVSTLDFHVPSAAIEINKWASDHTKGRIKAVVGDQVPSESVMLLLNATYFKAEWSRPFWGAHTHEGAFHVIDPQTKRLRSIRAAMMSRVDQMRFAKMNDWEAVELPYGAEGDASMIIALPPQVPANQIDMSVLPKLIDRVLGAARNPGVLRMPKFKFFASNALKNTLSQMGMEQAFSNGADFSGLTESKVKLSDVVQKVHVAVDEHGTEAAASTSIDIMPTSSPLHPLSYMNVNHPFYFVIRDNRDGTLLFVGHVEQPTF